MKRIGNYLLVLVLCGAVAVTSFYLGANHGYKLGYKVGGMDAIMYGLQFGKVECRYK